MYIVSSRINKTASKFNFYFRFMKIKTSNFTLQSKKGNEINNYNRIKSNNFMFIHVLTISCVVTTMLEKENIHLDSRMGANF